MGLDLTYRAGDQVFDIRFSMADWDTIGLLEEHVPGAFAACFAVPALCEPAEVALSTLRDAVDRLDAFLAGHPELLPYTYQFKWEYMDFGERGKLFGQQFDTGGVGCVRLPGDEEHRYTLWAGLNQLQLKKVAVQPDGKAKVVEERDLRGATELITTNMGRIQFRKRRAKTSLRKGLGRVRAFLAGVETPTVTKIIG